MTNEDATTPATTAQPEGGEVHDAPSPDRFWMIGVNEGRGSELLCVHMATGEILARYRFVCQPTRTVMLLESVAQKAHS